MKFEELQGKVIKEIIGKLGDDEMIFVVSDEEKYKLYYEHD